MFLSKVIAVFTTPITGGPTQVLVIRIQQLLKIKILSPSNHIRETNFNGIPTHHHSKIFNHNHHHQQSPNTIKELVANLHQMSMCLHIRRHKKTPTK